jgi:hypothetical protein
MYQMEISLYLNKNKPLAIPIFALRKPMEYGY